MNVKGGAPLAGAGDSTRYAAAFRSPRGTECRTCLEIGYDERLVREPDRHRSA
jgi:hypothetical protein